MYDRIYGGQKTRKKKAAVALARKIAVIAWAMLRDEKDWDPGKMIEVTKSYGGKLPMDEEALRNMPKKECRHKRKRRLAKERKAAEQAKRAAKTSAPQGSTGSTRAKASKKSAAVTARRSTKKNSTSTTTTRRTNTRSRARKPVSRA